MLKEKTILKWYNGVKKDYYRENQTIDMDEGDFNVLECEYDILKRILQK